MSFGRSREQREKQNGARWEREKLSQGVPACVLLGNSSRLHREMLVHNPRQ